MAAEGAEHVPFVEGTNLARTLGELQGEGIQIIGTAGEAKGTFYDCDLTGPLALVMGFEGSGMRRLTLDNCDELVRISMSGAVECLNLSIATGVCLSKACRQQRLAARG
ncbi:MAG: hypothetical protein KDA54_18720 [Phycisphaerales bacterium]|nr:hypothetical protein [Phycisphaerales bacterium]